jgi:hypothetical protein
LAHNAKKVSLATTVEGGLFMRPRTILFTAFCSIIVSGMAATAFAQQAGLIIVDIKPVAADVAKNLNVQASKIPLTVQAPVDVAAGVCQVPANVLRAQGGDGGASCAATMTSPALERLVRAKLRQQ